MRNKQQKQKDIKDEKKMRNTKRGLEENDF